MIQTNFKSVLMALVLVLPSMALTRVAKSIALLSDAPKAVVDEAWQLVNREYVDRSFNGHDWRAVRQDYLSRTYTSQGQAYQAVNEMVNLLEDEYTRFLPPQALNDLVNNVSGEFIGVGVTVSVNPQTREWMVVEPFRESPADNAGIRPRDVIVSLNGTKTADIDPRNAAPYLIGPVGSKLTMVVRRQDQQETYTLVREQINLNPLTYQARPTPKGKVGYIRLPVFTTKSPAAMKKAITDLEQQQVVGYILDLRGNPGGVLESGIAIAQQWIRQGRIMSLTTVRGGTEVYNGNQTALTQKPLQVLVDEESASASEVLAGALQDNQRAVLIGEKTFGKGVVQSLEKLGDGAGMVITVAKYSTPSGQDIHKKGIQPDEVIPTDDTALEHLETHRFDQDLAYQRAQANLLRSL
ncbi:S41 family peptidase [Lyngbya confervoides]|uniref:S41 family peptidase n=1 Tax=Lyngbya confervoides BDU141951 TaxID=1574623 RepID=A0ABD4T4E9_9CYAN|nr:S41 family peptidase [Lyngbya confervoides]MCM1983359.1 S41 family peptidase [Lyngbya confervoides BDU141951]